MFICFRVVRPCHCPCVRDSRGSFMFPRYLQYLLTDFRHQTFVTGASRDRDELIRFWVKRSKFKVKAWPNASQIFMFLLYLQYLLIDFRQTFVTGASWDTDDLITFLGQKVKVQGHTIAAEAHSTRRYRRVQLFLVMNYFVISFTTKHGCDVVIVVFDSMVEVVVWENQTATNSNIWRFSGQNDVSLVLFICDDKTVY